MLSSLKRIAIALMAAAALAGCTTGGHPDAGPSPSAVPRWATNCVGPSDGVRVRTFDSLTYRQALRAARRDDLHVRVVCTDGKREISGPPLTAGKWLFAALQRGRIVFAREHRV